MGKLYAFTLLAVCVISIIKSADAKISKPLSLACAVIPICAAVPYMAKTVSFVKSTVPSDIAGSIIYLPAIMICGELLASVCADMGEKALSESIALVTRIIMIAAMVDALSEITAVIGGILK